MLADSISSILEQLAPLMAAISDIVTHASNAETITTTTTSKLKFSSSDVNPQLLSCAATKEVSLNIPVTKYYSAKETTIAANAENINVITASIFPKIMSSDFILTSSVSTNLEDFSSRIALTM